MFVGGVGCVFGVSGVMRHSTTVAALGQQQQFLQCEHDVEKLAQMTLPSLGRFDAKSHGCVTIFNSRCVGPAAAAQAARLQHALSREKARFQREYNDRLFNGLVMVSLAVALISRFVLKRLVLEVVSWGSFIFLEVRLLQDVHDCLSRPHACA